MAALQRTQVRIALALAKVAEGFTPRSACGATGVSYRSLCRWREESDENEAAFDDAYNQGLAVDETELRRAFEEHPNLRLQYLMRKSADLQHTRRQVDVKVTGAVHHAVVAYEPKALDSFYDAVGGVRRQLDAASSPSSHVLAQGRVIDDETEGASDC